MILVVDHKVMTEDTRRNALRDWPFRNGKPCNVHENDNEMNSSKHDFESFARRLKRIEHIQARNLGPQRHITYRESHIQV
jgi:hypothetical protein